MPSAQSPSTRGPAGVGLSLDGARLSYAGRTIFHDLHLRLEPDAVTCLLGPSGVGKSSLLRLMAGLTPEATAGRMQADDGRPLAGRIAYMDQRDLLLPWLTALGNVMLGSRLRGEPRDTGRALALLQEVGLGGDAAAWPRTLSGGMRQRVALARTLMEDRPFVLMDEPFSALDALTRFRLQDLAARLLVGRTVLLVTHDPMEALRIGHRVHVLAGAPARLDRASVPPGTPPRDPADPLLQQHYGELLHRLGVGVPP